MPPPYLPKAQGQFLLQLQAHFPVKPAGPRWPWRPFTSSSTGPGIGPTNPPAPDGVVHPTPYPAADLGAFSVTIGGKAAILLFAGVVDVGEFQINIRVPAGVSGGDQAVLVTVNQIASPANVMLTMGA